MLPRPEPPESAAEALRVTSSESRSVKDLIEAQGVPHPEVARITVNGHDVDFNYLIADGDQIEVFPAAEALDLTRETQLGRAPLPALKFIADVHLGRLARYLRLLGLDCHYQPPWDDEALAGISAREHRIMLTRDKGLLKRRCIEHGILIRSDEALAQAKEVLARIKAGPCIKPFSRCVSCNGPLQVVAKKDVLELLPPGTRRSYDRFYQCQTCDKLYWRGAHYDKLTQLLAEITATEKSPPEEV